MSEETKLPTVEVLQFTGKIVFGLRNPDGKMAALREQEVSIMQSEFHTTFQAVADSLKEQVEGRLQAQANSNPPEDPPSPKPVNRASRRRIAKATGKGQ